MAIMSMTGFARADGADGAANWYWEIRSVNGRGLDVRLRLPAGSEGIEVPARELIGQRLTRGNVTAQLNQRRTTSGTQIVLNEEALGQIISVSEQVRKRLGAPAPTVEGLLGLRGVLDVVEVVEPPEVLEARGNAQLADLAQGLDLLVEARANEGRRLAVVVEDQLRRIAEIIETVTQSPSRSPEAVKYRLREMIGKLVSDRAQDFDEARLHQEAVLLATKADIEEELQRLRAHVGAARDLLQSEDSVGRRLDFLTQEFNREANTLCSKSNDTEVTRLGLQLKSVIEQMREQVQNIE
ncbi:MAG: YicC family protein [Alphaproteobacteria bacterium]|nr:YicC family protein [Alphaproteobacteria bacterium]